MKKILSVFASLLYIDLLFIILGFNSISLGTIIRITITNLAISFLLSFIKKEKTFKIVSVIVILLFAVYAFIQLEFKNFMSTFYSFKAVSNGIAGVKGYIWYFISSSKPSFYLVLISLIIYYLIYHYYSFDYSAFIKRIYKNKYKKGYKKKLNERNKKIEKYSLFTKILITTNLITLSFLLPYASRQDDLVLAYTYNDNYDLVLSRVGSNHFFFKDLYSLAFPKKYNFTIDKNDYIEQEDYSSTISSSNVKNETIRMIDDTKWISLKEDETNESIKNIDNYLLSLNPYHQNEYTGQFEDYNFIYFLVESLDYMAIDEHLTPTLYKLWNEGYHFTNHYTPIYSCATGDSEFVSMTGIYPYRSVCTPYEVLNTNLETSLAGLFKEKGYNTRSYHNWNDQFYKRNQLEYAYGMKEYKDVDALDINLIVGWQSDKALVEKALPDFINDDKFFTFFITSSMHWPYDCESNLGDKYINEINEYYKEYPIEIKRYLSKSMEFDKALELLITSLEEAGKLDNTVISIFPDHHPLKFERSVFEKYTQLTDRTGTYRNNLTPFIIYNSKTESKEIDNVCSTIDHVPTIANLFNLNYDPRLYMGNDAFNDDCIVIFNNLDWITSKGIYIKSQNKGTSGLDEEYITQINSHVNNITNISKAILDYDYFEKRKDIIYPTYQ